MTKLTYLGHSCFLVELSGKTLLFDPFITGNDATKGIVDINTLLPDYILLSHAHADHILDAEVIAKEAGATLISNYEIATTYAEMGIENTIPMNHGGTIRLDNDITVKMTNAVHTSSFPDGSYGGQPAGFIISNNETSFYYSGDTALHTDMKLIGDEWGGVDFAMLCLGDHFTMGYEDAIIAARYIGSQKIIGMHFDTFPPIAIDREKVEQAFTVANLSIKLPEIGEILNI